MSQSQRRNNRGQHSHLCAHVSAKSKGHDRCKRKEQGRTHEEVVGVGIGAANLEQLHQIVELAVNVSADGDGAFLCSSSVSFDGGLSSGRRAMDIRQAGRWIRLEEPLLPSHTVSGHRPRTAACRPSSSQSSHRGWGSRAGRWVPPTWEYRALRQHLPCWCPLCRWIGDGWSRQWRGTFRQCKAGRECGPDERRCESEGVDVCVTCAWGRQRADQGLGQGAERECLLVNRCAKTAEQEMR